VPHVQPTKFSNLHMEITKQTGVGGTLSTCIQDLSRPNWRMSWFCGAVPWNRPNPAPYIALPAHHSRSSNYIRRSYGGLLGYDTV